MTANYVTPVVDGQGVFDRNLRATGFRPHNARMKKSTHTREYEFVVKKLVEMRQKAGLTQRELAKRLNREPSFVWRIEKGERRLDVLEFYWVCRALDTAPQSVYADLCSSFHSCECPEVRSARSLSSSKK